MRFVASLIVMAIAAPALRAGDLTPPAGPPASTMKTLDQVEARIPLSQQSAPGNAQYEFIISQPGSYYLTRNLTNTASTAAIRIQTDNVTLDLNGYSLVGNGGTMAISLPPSSFYKNIIIRNGSFRNWSHAIVGSADSAIIEDITVIGCGYGIFFEAASYGMIVRNCTLAYITSIGIAGGNAAIISECSLRGVGTGIHAPNGALVSRCAVRSATSVGIQGTDSLVRECVVTQSTTPYNLSGGSVKSDSIP